MRPLRLAIGWALPVAFAGSQHWRVKPSSVYSEQMPLSALSRMRRAFAPVAGLLLVGCLGAGTAGCGRDPFPDTTSGVGPLGPALPVAARLTIRGLKAPVDAVRDIHGRTHIYASSTDDAMRAEGYLVAVDRGVQIELIRRLASGRLAEVFGGLDPGQVQSDIAFRTIGLRRVAEQQYAAVDGDARAVLDAFADGVSQALLEYRDGVRKLPAGLAIMEPSHFGEFTPVDALTIGRLQTWLLSYEGDEVIGFQRLFDDLRATFNAAAEEPALAKLAGFERDYLRFSPPVDATTIDGLDQVGAKALSLKGAGTQPRANKAPERRQPASRQPAASGDRFSTARRQAAERAQGFVAALERGRAGIAPSGDFGSNNWAVAPVRSLSGHAMLASDPHLTLSSPAVFWPVSIHVPADLANGDAGLDLGGIAFPGIPGIILGHNAHIAWGATVAGYDVTDVYTEQLSQDGNSVTHNGAQVPLQTIEEIIPLPNGKSLTYKVRIVPHHGPIVPTIVDNAVVDPVPGQSVLSIRWTGHDATGEISAIIALMKARTVYEARAAFDTYGTGAQNWMLADVDGNIGWTTHSLVPLRAPGALNWDPASYSGVLPCMILPGDGSADWTGFWDGEAVPWAINPLAGYLATANQDQVGGTLDNDPSNDVQPNGDSGYLACSFALGFRQARIKERIEELGSGLTIDDLSLLQSDVKSPLGARFVPPLLVAMENALKEFAGGDPYPDLFAVVTDPGYDQNRIAALRTLLATWRDGYGYQAVSGMDPDYNSVTSLDHPEVAGAQATLLFNVWLVRFLRRTFGDELSRIGRTSGTGHDIRAMLHLFSSDPAGLATYDPMTGDSALWDDIDTPELETRQERMMRALLDALSWLDDNVDGGIDWWRWGQHHTVRFEPLAPVWGQLAIPSNIDSVFPSGYPRHGDMYVIDASNYDLTRALDDAPSFAYRSGPTQRFTVELAPGALRVRNVLPGGAVYDPSSKHFADQAQEWRKNAIHDVPFYLPDVIQAAESRAVLSSP